MVKILNCYLYAKKSYGTLSKGAIFFYQPCTYCCDVKAYENYYLNQLGHGNLYFSGGHLQQDYKLGNIFSAISKTIVPLIKSGAKANGKQTLKSGVGFASVVIKEKNVKQAAIDCEKAADLSLLHHVVAPKRKDMTPKVQKKRRKKNLEVFD